MNTQEAARYCGVTTSVLLYVARRDGIGTKQGSRWSFTHEELDRTFGASAPQAARLQSENARLREALRQIADRSDAEMEQARTLHYDMRDVARAAIERP